MQNEPLQLKLTTKYDSGAREDQILYQRIHSFDTGILKDVIIRQTGIESVTSIAVTLQLRPLTDSAVPTPLKDKDRQKLMRNVSKMVEEAETCITKVIYKRNPLQIRIQIQNYSWESQKSGKLEDVLIKKQYMYCKRTIIGCVFFLVLLA